MYSTTVHWSISLTGLTALNDQTVFEQTVMPKLIKNKELCTYMHKAFWHPMDTPRDKESLENLWDSKKAPWKNWK